MKRHTAVCTDQECPKGISKTQQGCLWPAWRQRSYFHGDPCYSLNAININAALGSEEERGLRVRAGFAPFCTQSLGKLFSSRPPAFPLSHPPALPSKDQGSAGPRLLFLCSPMPSRLPLSSASKVRHREGSFTGLFPWQQKEQEARNSGQASSATFSLNAELFPLWIPSAGGPKASPVLWLPTPWMDCKDFHCRLTGILKLRRSQPKPGALNQRPAWYPGQPTQVQGNCQVLSQHPALWRLHW